MLAGCLCAWYRATSEGEDTADVANGNKQAQNTATVSRIR